mmetsp:Transcript_16577/g.38299  ORF Transcript_16577/g.38299 Transcript_16577/m.38299 type:complete len:232 (-) Transcript_16577:576-1271(-)
MSSWEPAGLKSRFDVLDDALVDRVPASVMPSSASQLSSTRSFKRSLHGSVNANGPACTGTTPAHSVLSSALLVGCNGSNHHLGHQGKICSCQSARGRRVCLWLHSMHILKAVLKDAGKSRALSTDHGFSRNEKVKGTPFKPEACPPIETGMCVASSLWEGCELQASSADCSGAKGLSAGNTAGGSTKGAKRTDSNISMLKYFSDLRTTRRNCCVRPAWKGPTSTPPTSKRP